MWLRGASYKDGAKKQLVLQVVLQVVASNELSRPCCLWNVKVWRPSPDILTLVDVEDTVDGGADVS